MKKIILALAINCSLLISAQNKTDSNIGKISYGVKGGLNISNVTDQSFTNSNNYFNQKSRVGFNAGAFVNIPISKSFSIQPELLFSQYGYKTKYYFNVENDLIYDGSNTLNLGYLTIPVMVQYNITPNFYVETGIELGYNITAKEKINENFSFGGNTQIIDETRDFNRDYLNSFNFGAGVGAGYYFSQKIGVTARYVWGFTNTEKNPDNLPNETAVRNKVFQVGLAYKF